MSKSTKSRDLKALPSTHEPLSLAVLHTTQLAALGSVVAESAYLERLIEVIISLLANVDQGTREIFLHRAMIGAKIDLMAELAKRKLKTKKRKVQFENIVSNINRCNEQRIVAVHGIWWPTKPILGKNLSGEARAATSRGGVITTRGLEKLAKEISDCHWALFGFYREVWHPRVPRQPKKHPKSGG